MCIIVSFVLRMVVAGHDMIRGIFADSAKVFHYDKAYGLTQDEVLCMDITP